MSDDIARLARDRQEADRQYNDALTELDRSIVGVGGRELARPDFDRLATALIRYLQRITAFVETKDRELAGDTGARLDRLASALEPIAELRTQIGVLQRRVHALERSRQSTVDSRQPVSASHDAPSFPSHQPLAISHDAPSSPSHQPSAISHDVLSSLSQDDVTYVGFEDQFRGSDETIQRRLSAYLPLFAGASDVVDLGCGRGEFLESLKNAGIRARGVDANGEMAALARERGLDVAHGDALAFMASVTDESLGGVIAAQVIEHLEPAYLMRLLTVASRKLRPGAPIVLETINPACWLAFFSSYIRDLTHVRPIHPETLQYLLSANGFERVVVQYSAPVADQMKMKAVELSADVMRSADPSAQGLVGVAHAVNANAAILNALLFSHLDYAAIGYRA